MISILHAEIISLLRKTVSQVSRARNKSLLDRNKIEDPFMSQCAHIPEAHNVHVDVYLSNRCDSMLRKYEPDKKPKQDVALQIQKMRLSYS